MGVTDWPTASVMQEDRKTKVTLRKRAFVKLPDGQYLFQDSAPVLSPKMRASIMREVDKMEILPTPIYGQGGYISHNIDSKTDIGSDPDDPSSWLKWSLFRRLTRVQTRLRQTRLRQDQRKTPS